MVDACPSEDQVLLKNDYESSRYLHCALEVFSSLSSFYKFLELVKCHHGNLMECHAGFLKQALQSQRMNQTFDKLNLHNLLKQKLRDSCCDFIDIIECILDSFHCCTVNSLPNTNKKTMNDDGCNDYCIAHKLFSLPIVEEYSCECGTISINKSNPRILSQNCTIYSIFAEWDSRKSIDINNIPRFILKSTNIPSNTSIKDKLIPLLRKCLKSFSVQDSCRPECSHLKNSVILKLQNTPEIYMLNINWDNKKATHFTSFLSTLSINKKFNMNELYNSTSESYTIKGIVFSRNNKFEYAHCKIEDFEERWVFRGLSKQCGYLQLLEEVVIMKYSPVFVVYEKGDLLEFEEVEDYKLKKIEILALQCDSYKKSDGKDIMGPDEDCSRRFLNWKMEGIEKKRSSKEMIGDSSKFDSMNPWPNDCSSNDDLQNVSIFSSAKVNISEPDNKLSEFQSDINKRTQGGSSEEMASGTTVNKIKEHDQWKCDCGELNTNDWDVCISCKKSLRPGLDGWICDHCTFLNTNSFRCEGCNILKYSPKTAIRDTWSCRYCSRFNLEPETVCECGEKRLNQDEFIKHSKRDSKELNLKENWICCYCNTKNNLNLDICVSCKKSKNYREIYDFSFCRCSHPTHNSLDSRICNTCNKRKPQEQSINESMRDSFTEESGNIKKPTIIDKSIETTSNPLCEDCERLHSSSTSKNTKSMKLGSSNACKKCLKLQTQKNCKNCSFPNPSIICPGCSQKVLLNDNCSICKISLKSVKNCNNCSKTKKCSFCRNIIKYDLTKCSSCNRELY